jgi:hypothetical protein
MFTFELTFQGCNDCMKHLYDLGNVVKTIMVASISCKVLLIDVRI